MSSASRSILRRLALALAAVAGHLARLGRPRRLLPLAQRRQQSPVDDEVRVAADRRGEVAVGGAAEAGMAAVAVAVGGLYQGTEHERCIRLAAVPAPRRLSRPRAGSPAPPPRPPGSAPGPAAAAASARRARAAARPGARPAPDRAGRGRGRRPAPACAPAAAPPVRWRGSSAARSGGGTRSAATERAATTFAGRVEAKLGLGGLDVEAGRAALLAQRRRRLTGHRQRLGNDLGRGCPRPAKTRSSWS